MRTPAIRGIIETSLTHWPGRIAAVVFVGGCPLHCPHCPAPHLRGASEEAGEIPRDAVLDTLYRRRRWVEGVVVKGGEPFAVPGLRELLELLKDFSLPVRVDTPGLHPEAMVDGLRRGLVDTVAVEIKAPLTEAYRKAAGGDVDLGALFATTEILLSGGWDHEFRTAVYGDLLTEEDILSIARTIRGARRYVLRSVPGRGPGRAALRRIARRAGRYVRACHLDGLAPEREAGTVPCGLGRDGGAGRG